MDSLYADLFGDISLELISDDLEDNEEQELHLLCDKCKANPKKLCRRCAKAIAVLLAGGHTPGIGSPAMSDCEGLNGQNYAPDTEADGLWPPQPPFGPNRVLTDHRIPSHITDWPSSEREISQPRHQQDEHQHYHHHDYNRDHDVFGPPPPPYEQYDEGPYYPSTQSDLRQPNYYNDQYNPHPSLTRQSSNSSSSQSSTPTFQTTTQPQPPRQKQRHHPQPQSHSHQRIQRNHPSQTWLSLRTQHRTWQQTHCLNSRSFHLNQRICSCHGDPDCRTLIAMEYAEHCALIEADRGYTHRSDGGPGRGIVLWVPLLGEEAGRWKGMVEVKKRRGGYIRRVWGSMEVGRGDGVLGRNAGVNLKIQRVDRCVLWERNPCWALLPFLWDGGDVGLLCRWERCVWVSRWGNPFSWLLGGLKRVFRRLYGGLVGWYFGCFHDDLDGIDDEDLD